MVVVVEIAVVLVVAVVVVVLEVQVAVVVVVVVIAVVLVVVVVLVLEVQVAVVVVVVVIAVVLVVAVVVMVMVEVVEVFFPQNVTNSSSILRIQSLNLPLAVKVLQHFPYDCSKEEASSEWMALAYGLENQTLHFSRQNSQRRWNPFNVKTKPLAWTESI